MADPRKRGIGRKVADFLELPPDVVLDVARITIVGRVQLAVENHRGLLEYTPERVTISTSGGELVVEGDDLTIGSVGPEAVTVMGLVRTLRFGE